MKKKIPAPYATGYRAEREAFRILEDDGYMVMRAAGSHGMFDLAAFHTKEVRLIQIKVIGYKQKRKFQKEQAILKSLKLCVNVKKELWVYEKRRGWHYYICK